jgi:tetratricopeptide (TPR) repeat protein
MRLLRALALAAACTLGAAPAFQPQPGERAFLDALDHGHRPLEAREAARAYLAQHPDSFLACEAIGIVYLQAEGNLPRALYYLTRARRLMEASSRGVWKQGAPLGYYAATLSLLSETQFRMDRYEESLASLAELERRTGRKDPARYAWPLMRMGRVREARRKIAEARASGNPGQVATALNTLGALESELDNPEAAYATHQETRAFLLGRNQPDCSIIRNCGDGAMVLGRFREAEGFFLEATEHFNAGTVSNPWGDLASLYLLEQRFPEAMDAIRRMHAWAWRTLPLMAGTHWNLRQTLTGGLLFYGGCTEEALRLARQLAERPDRHAAGSARDGQREAGSELFLVQALEDAQARDAEAWSQEPWKHRPAVLLARSRHALEAAMARRRCGALLMANRERFSQTLRFLGPQDIETLPGGAILLARVVGPGVVEAEARRLLARTGPAADRERGFLLLVLGSARLERGDARGALVVLDQAAGVLPAECALLHTQLQALRAAALLALGDRAGALAPLMAVMQRDGGEVRRRGLALPCWIQAQGGAAGRAGALLAHSPRLDPGSGGFRVLVEPTPGGGLQGGLYSPSGAVLRRLGVPPGPDPDATARAFCREFHRKVFAPNLDLSQQQIRSLEGSTLASQDAAEQFRGILAP